MHFLRFFTTKTSSNDVKSISFHQISPLPRYAAYSIITFFSPRLLFPFLLCGFFNGRNGAQSLMISWFHVYVCSFLNYEFFIFDLISSSFLRSDSGENLRSIVEFFPRGIQSNYFACFSIGIHSLDKRMLLKYYHWQ